LNVNIYHQKIVTNFRDTFLTLPTATTPELLSTPKPTQAEAKSNKEGWKGRHWGNHASTILADDTLKIHHKTLLLDLSVRQALDRRSFD